MDENVDINEAIQAYNKTGAIKVAEPIYTKDIMSAAIPDQSLLSQNEPDAAADPKLK